MGREAKVEFVAGRERVQVRAHLDSQSLELTGGKKLTIPLAAVKSATVEGDVLNIAAGAIKFSLALGAKEAEAWRKKILKPPSLADKLGFKPDKTIMLVGAAPTEIVQVATSAATAAKPPRAFKADIAIVMLTPGKEPPLIAASARALRPGQALWLVYEKGRPMNGDGVIALARAAGLNDTKVARVSETHAALRFIRK